MFVFESAARVEYPSEVEPVFAEPDVVWSTIQPYLDGEWADAMAELRRRLVVRRDS